MGTLSSLSFNIQSYNRTMAFEGQILHFLGTMGPLPRLPHTFFHYAYIILIMWHWEISWLPVPHDQYSTNIGYLRRANDLLCADSKFMFATAGKAHSNASWSQPLRAVIHIPALLNASCTYFKYESNGSSYWKASCNQIFTTLKRSSYFRSGNNDSWRWGYPYITTI